MDRLAYEKECDGCHSGIYMAICSDGRWRPFETRTIPAGPFGVWAWRKHQGMQEQELVPGHPIHYCPAFHTRLDLAGALP